MNIYNSESKLSVEKTFDAFKFYEEAADKTKGHAWAQTTWILSLNAAILGFSFNLYAEHPDLYGLLVIECIAALAGVVLCGYLIFFVLDELGSHIRNYWTKSNKLASTSEPLIPFISEKEAQEAKEADYYASFPRFIKRLKVPAILFAIAHLGWAIYLIYLGYS